MKTTKIILIMVVMLFYAGLHAVWAQWGTNGNNIFNTNSGNVGIGHNTPAVLLHAGKNMTEPTILVQNFGGSGGATYQMTDNASGADWKFKATLSGGFKIRDHANQKDVIVIEPYTAVNNALYIKGGGNVGFGTAAPHNSALVEMMSNDKGFLPPRMTESQRTSIGSPAAGLMVYQTDLSYGYYYHTGTEWKALASSNNPAHYIGELYGGGIVFYVYDGGQHGLIAPTTDQYVGIQWYNGTARITSTSGDGLNAGAMNTALIVATQMADNQAGNFAAKVCADYSVTFNGITYGDWYLPSKYELNLLYLEKNMFGNLSGNYWSSTEFNVTYAWFQNFTNPLQNVDVKNNYLEYHVRAIRAF
jgi:hypothetical protein